MFSTLQRPNFDFFHFYFVICKCLEFGPVQNFVVSQRLNWVSFICNIFAGSLNFYQNATGSPSLTLMWTLSGNKGNQWIQGQFPIPPVQSTYVLYMEAVRGTTYAGDVAVDDIVFSQSSCGCM